MDIHALSTHLEECIYVISVRRLILFLIYGTLGPMGYSDIVKQLVASGINNYLLKGSIRAYRQGAKSSENGPVGQSAKLCFRSTK